MGKKKIILLDKKQRRLPNYNNEYTDDVEKYCDAWHKLAAPIEKFLGLELSAFDPDFKFIDAKEKYKLIVELPLWFVEKFNEAIKKVKKK
jgi:hypothetical protein